MSFDRIFLCALVASFAFALSPALAQSGDGVVVREVGEDEADKDALPEGRNLFWEITAGGAHQFETDVDDGGSFEVTRVSTSVAAFYIVNEQLSVTTAVSYELNAFDFSGTSSLGGGDPWDNIHSLRGSALFKYKFDDQWTIYGGPMLGFSAESGADIDDAVTGGGVIGGSYRVNKDLVIGAGVGVFSKIEDSAAIFPIIRFDWKFAPQWTLRSGRFDLGSEGGAGVELAYDPTETIQIAAGAQYQTRRFRLDDTGAAPGGVGEETIVPVYARLSYNPNRSLSLSVFGGVIFGGEVRLENSSGSNIADKDFDPAPVIGGRAVFRF